MAECTIIKSGLTLTPNLFTSGETTAGTAITLNSGLLVGKRIAIVTGFVVGANTNTPTLTCTFYGSNDGTNFTQIGTPLSLQKTGGATASRVASKEFDATGYTYYRVVTNSISSGISFGYSVSMSLI